MNVTCAFCHVCYDDRNRKPLLLPCGHTYCHECVVEINRDGGIKCIQCKSRWKHRVEDLTSCHQLVPELSFNVKSTVGPCSVHQMPVTIWCQSCSGPYCTQCFRSNHEACDWLFLEEWFNFGELQQNVGVEETKAKIAEIVKLVMEGKKILLLVQNLKEKFQTLENQLMKYEESLVEKKCELDELLNQYFIKDSLYQSSSERIGEMQKVVRRMSEISITPIQDCILFHIAHSFNNAPADDVHNFIANMQKFSNILHESDGILPKSIIDRSSESRSDHDCLENLENAISVSKANRVWTVTDRLSTEKVVTILKTSSLRPSAIFLKWADWQEEDLQSLMPFSPKSVLDILVPLNDTFRNPSDTTVSKTRERIDALAKQGGRCILKEFWGHLDPEIVAKMPSTLKVLGIALRYNEDMKAVTSLWNNAFKHTRNEEKPYRKLWCHLEQIHLSLKKSFRSENRNWSFISSKSMNNLNNKMNLGFGFTIQCLSELDIQLGLHIFSVGPEDLHWIAEIVGDFELDNGVADLFLPDARISAEALLKMLVECEVQFKVHFPMKYRPQTSSRELLNHYKERKCSITFDLMDHSDDQ